MRTSACVLSRPSSDLGVNDSTTDIYPAQDEVDLTPEDWDKKRKGNFVNLPYQKAHMTTRVCMDNDGNSIKLENLYKIRDPGIYTDISFQIVHSRQCRG